MGVRHDIDIVTNTVRDNDQGKSERNIYIYKYSPPQIGTTSIIIVNTKV